MCQGFPRWLKDNKQLWQGKLCGQLEMCQSSWEFHCELVQSQIIVIEFYPSWVRDNTPLDEERALHDSALPLDLLLVCSAVSSFVCSRSDASLKCCIYHACSVYSVYSHLLTQLLLRLPRLLKVIFYAGVLMLKCFPFIAPSYSWLLVPSPVGEVAQSPYHVL